jgi:Arc/MetJ family transcription regulator
MLCLFLRKKGERGIGSTHYIWKQKDSCEGKTMVTNLNVDTDLLQEAVALSGETTAEALVEKALRVYVQYHKQLQEIDLFGAIASDKTDDSKPQRQSA